MTLRQYPVRQTTYGLASAALPLLWAVGLVNDELDRGAGRRRTDDHGGPSDPFSEIRVFTDRVRSADNTAVPLLFALLLATACSAGQPASNLLLFTHAAASSRLPVAFMHRGCNATRRIARCRQRGGRQGKQPNERPMREGQALVVVTRARGFGKRE